MKVLNQFNLKHKSYCIYGGVTTAVIALPVALPLAVVQGSGAEIELSGRTTA